MTVRRLLFALALLPTVGSPVIAAQSGLLASVGAFYGGLLAAGVVAFWPRTERGHEREIHRAIARNQAAGDPR